MDNLQGDVENVQKELKCLRSRKGRYSKQHLQDIAVAQHRLQKLQGQILQLSNKVADHQNEQHSFLNDHLPSIEDQFLNQFSSSYSENLEFARIFEDKQKSLDFKYCEVCSKICFQLSDSTCESCLKFTQQNIQNVNPFSAMNNMEPGMVPPELDGLTLIEQILISRVKVCMTVFRLHGGQYGYNGQVINFNQDVSEMTKRLPHSLDSLSNILIIRRESDDVSTFKEFRVRKSVVWKALIFLINNHSGYKNIVNIDQHNIEQLQEDASVYDHLTQIPSMLNLSTNDTVEQHQSSQQMRLSNDSIDLIEHTASPSLHIPNIRQDVDQILEIDRLSKTLQNSEGDQTVLPFPHISFEPVNEFTTPGYIACAFPCLFPTGMNK